MTESKGILPDYLTDVGREMAAKSAGIRRDFASHNPSAGENREDLVETFLKQHLPSRFGVSTGFVFSHSGERSNQADLIVVDAVNNAPLYSTSSNVLWPVEAVYAMFEVKANLSPEKIADSVAKCRRFKRQQRRFLTPSSSLSNSLFVIWAFNAPAPITLKANLVAALSGVPRAEQPDLIVVLGSVVAQCGSLFELTALGEPNSDYRVKLTEQYGQALPELEVLRLYEFGEHALLIWFIWFDSWLRRTIPRLTDPMCYLPLNVNWGRRI